MHLSLGQCVTNQSILLPLNCLMLIRIRVRETLDLTSLAPKQAVEVGSNLIALLCLQIVTLSTTCL